MCDLLFIEVFLCVYQLQNQKMQSHFILHDFTTFIDDTPAAGLAVLKHLLWHLILYLFWLFPRKWHKILAAGFVR